MITPSNLYVLFGGTEDYYEELVEFLENIPHTLLDGTWHGGQAQVIIFFSREDAEKVKKFLLEDCQQKCVPIFQIEGTLL